MAVHVRIPSPLRSFTQNREEVPASGTTVREVVADLERNYPGIGGRLLDDAGRVRRYVNLFLNDEDVRFLRELETPVKDGDRIALVPAIAGGR
jgi:molybdopterin synthase sulfur carrier subunit